MRDGGDDRIVDTHTRATTVTREKEREESKKWEQRKNEYRISKEFSHEKAFVAKEEINGVVVYFRKKRTATAIN